jgi:hypothetical protein
MFEAERRAVHRDKSTAHGVVGPLRPVSSAGLGVNHSGGIVPPALLGVMSQMMNIRASRGVRLLIAAAMAWLGLALCAQAAHATYGTVTIVKINKGGNANDSFAFHPSVEPGQPDFSLKGGEQTTFQVECNVDRPGLSCSQWANPQLTVTELSTPGYTLESIECVHTQGTNKLGDEPNASSAADNDTTVSGSTINLKVSYWEWVKCTVTNTPTPPENPQIQVVKDGPATAHSGDLLTFGYTVTNPGNVPLTGVTATDDKCSPLTRTGDTSDTTLDPGDTWTYTCSYVIQWSQGDANPVVNTVTTCGTPPAGDNPGGPGTVCDTDQHSTTVLPPAPVTQPETPAQAAGTSPTTQPQIAVSPARVRPGSARLRGPSGCPTTSAVAATVTGRRIVKVTYYVDGRRVKTLTKANASGGRWVLPMNVKRFAFGTHRVQARIQFARSSQTSSRTLRLSFNRCRPAIVTPKFTG